MGSHTVKHAKHTILWAYSTESPSLMGTNRSVEGGLVSAYLRKRRGNPALGTPLGTTWEDLLETDLASELGRASICWVIRNCFPSLPFPYFRPCVLRRLGPSCSFPFGLFPNSVRPALWYRGCLRTEHGSSETGCWLIGSIGWFIHIIRTVQPFCQFCTRCLL